MGKMKEKERERAYRDERDQLSSSRVSERTPLRLSSAGPKSTQNLFRQS